MTGSRSNLLDVVSKRSHVIDCLLDGVTDKRDLENELEVSRQTVSRSLEELDRVDVLTDSRVAEGEVTLYGKLAHRQYKQLETAYEQLSAAKDLLTHSPADGEIDMRLLTGAKVRHSNRCAPQEPFHEVTEMVRSADSVRWMWPVVLPSYVEFFHEQIAEREVETDLVLEPDLLEHLSTYHDDEFAAIERAPNCTLLEVSEIPEFGLVVVDDEEVCVAIHRDGGTLRGVVVNDTDPAVEWATELYDRYRKRATERTLRRHPSK